VFTPSAGENIFMMNIDESGNGCDYSQGRNNAYVLKCVCDLGFKKHDKTLIWYSTKVN
jgi:hypothetical protein